MSGLRGKCMCGAVSFTSPERPTDLHVCHCGQCQAWSGWAWASAGVSYDTLDITDPNGTLTWYRSSDYARRGFCSKCGSSLFWHGDKLDDWKHRIAVAAGTLEQADGDHVHSHIFCADKNPAYKVPEGELTFETFPDGTGSE